MPRLLLAGAVLAGGCYHHDPRAHAPDRLLDAPMRQAWYRSGPRVALLSVRADGARLAGVTRTRGEALESSSALELGFEGRPSMARASLGVGEAERRVEARVEAGRLFLSITGVSGRTRQEVPWGPSSRLDPGDALLTALWLSRQPEGPVRVVRLDPADPRGRVIEQWDVRVGTHPEGHPVVAGASSVRRVAAMGGEGAAPRRVREWRWRGRRWVLVRDWRAPRTAPEVTGTE